MPPDASISPELNQEMFEKQIADKKGELYINRIFLLN